MKVKNTSTKIVHIGAVTILPDEVETVDDSLKNAPVVSLFIKRGDIQIVTGKSAGKGSGKSGKGGKGAPAGGGDTEDTQGDGSQENGGEGQSEGKSEGE